MRRSKFGVLAPGPNFYILTWDKILGPVCWVVQSMLYFRNQVDLQTVLHGSPKSWMNPTLQKNDTFSFEHIVAFLRMMRVNRKVTDSYWKYFGASHDQFVRMIVIIVWFWIFHVWPSTIFISVSRSTTPIKTLPNHDKAGKTYKNTFGWQNKWFSYCLAELIW